MSASPPAPPPPPPPPPTGRGGGRRPGSPPPSEPQQPPAPPDAFYDALAAVYHLIYPDWHAARQSQARVFADLLSTEGVMPGAELLDCAAGIGTQALGLAAAGYRLTATDVSATALRRLALEARRLNLHMRIRPCDMRDLADLARMPRDAVMAVDNAIPHFLSEQQILLALRAIAGVLKPGGLLLLSMRDYDRCLDDGERPLGEGPFIHDAVPPRRILYQVWDWQDERIYDAHLYITWRAVPLADSAGDGKTAPWQVHHGVTRYRALRRAELARLARTTGFTDCVWRMPAETGFYQPVMLARRQ